MTKISINQPVIDALPALRAVQAAIEHAQHLGVRVNIAVVDRAGLTVAFARMAGAALHAMEYASNKAYTAASFGLPTDEWHAELLNNHSPAVREGLPRHPRFAGFAGGFPIVENGERIGGIGVSGGSGMQDEEIAQAGLRALGLS